MSCNDIHTTTGADVDGFYWIDPTGSGEPYQAFCDMTTDGGGWTLVLQASSTSTYTYDATVWTATGTTSNEVPTPVADADRVSRAFYELSGGQSLLCMGDLAHCAGWSHVADTARNLANGPRPGATQATGGSCATLLCASNTFPAVMSQLMGGSSSDTYYRWGYVNDVNPWGTRTRVGFTGDGDSSDSSDTIIGLGVECAGANCPVHDCTSGCHNQGAGYYGYDGWNVAPYDNPLQGFLFVR
ncbi:MAG: hypothetical protein EP329_24620 [Deltaproteobacteria bacterium]|nr:MAG: hypothetical protein EP329_24620 [Deltaproteobacteria bacterium]